MTSRERLRTLCSALGELHPPQPAENPVKSTKEELGRRLNASRDGLVAVGEEVEVVDEGVEKDVLLRMVGTRSLDLLVKIQGILLSGDGSNKVELLLSLPERATIRQSLTFLLSHTLTLSTHLLPYLASTAQPSPTSPRITNVTTLLLPLLDLLLPPSSSSNTTPSTTLTPITQTLRQITHLPLLLPPSLLLSFSPLFPPPTYLPIRKTIIDLLTLLPPAESIAHLGAALVYLAPRRKVPGQVGWPGWARRAAEVLMGKQVGRNGGVKGLMQNVFAGVEGKNEVIELNRLEHLAKATSTIPPGTTTQEYYSLITPQLIHMIRPPTDTIALPEQYIHAACFVVCRMLEGDAEGFGGHVVPLIHGVLLPTPPTESQGDKPILIVTPAEVDSALTLLLPLLTHSPPSSTLITLLLTPLLSPLIALLAYLSESKTGDPVLRGELRGLVRVWGRVVDEQEGVVRLGKLGESGRGWGGEKGVGGELFWGTEVEGEGGVGIFFGRPPTIDLSSLRTQAVTSSPEITLSASSAPGPSGPSKTIDLDPDSTTALDSLSDLDLQPSPKLVIELVKSFERPAMAGKFFAGLLGRYQAAEELVGDPMKSVYYLQMILLMTQEMGEGLLSQPGEVLSFVEHALRRPEVKKGGEGATAFDALDLEEDEEGEADSDDEEEEGEEVMVGDIEDEEEVKGMGLVETAVNLLMAVMASQDNLSPEKYPLLLVIEQHLNRLAKSRQPQLKQLARQSLMLLSVRRAGQQTLTSSKGSSSQPTPTVEKYREALKLLQDQLLPVRAHGLILLQEVVKAKDFDRALIPGIMDVFLSSIQDDDSYMYLNAVKGLSSMVDGLGAEVMKSLVFVYCEGLERLGEMKEDELDKRLRLGEGLMQAVKRSGEAFGGYAKIVVPPLLRIFPRTSLPTVLRASSLSILSTAAQTSHLSLLPWSDDLVSSCLDLLQIESVPAGKGEVAEGAEPTKGNDGKHPALRRGALVFLGEMFVAVFEAKEAEMEKLSTRTAEISLSGRQDGGAVAEVIAVRTLRRAKTVLGYVKATDVDSLVRYQAGEGLRLLDDLLQVV